jgi:hypothetical protein
MWKNQEKGKQWQIKTRTKKPFIASSSCIMVEVLHQMAGKELMPLPMDTEVNNICASTGIACLFIVWILVMRMGMIDCHSSWQTATLFKYIGRLHFLKGFKQWY